MPGTFRNASMCEDIREEIGNKKSLMGVFSGDVLVPRFPARFRVAFYAEYLPALGGEHEVRLSIEIGAAEAATAQVRVNTAPGQPATLVIPQGVAQFDAPGEIILRATAEDVTTELLRKSVRLAD